MQNPESARLLSDERGTLEAEAALAREEQRLWLQLEAAAVDPFAQRSQALLARLSILVQSGEVHPDDVAQARQIIAEASAAVPAPAPLERAAALAARQAALEAREAATRALMAGLAQVESLRATRARDLDEVEQFLSAAEKAIADSAADRKRKAEEAARREAEEAAARKAAEEAARAEAARLAAEAEARVRAAKAAEEASLAATVPEQSLPAEVVAAKAAVVDPAPPVAAAPAAATKKKASRRRRTRVAPPPPSLSFEVAPYGDNNFYAGFDNDVSRGGVFVSSLETLPRGHELQVEISLEGQTIPTRARVEFVREDNLANAECTPGAGLKLLDLSQENLAAIQSFLTKRPPMFYVEA